jgi:hypothetical protein
VDGGRPRAPTQFGSTQNPVRSCRLACHGCRPFGRANLPLSRTAVWPPLREGEAPAEPKHPSGRPFGRAKLPLSRNTCLAVGSHGSAGASPSHVWRLGRSLALPRLAARRQPRPPGLAARRQPRPPGWNQRAAVRCPLSGQHPLASANGSPSECLDNWCVAWSECFCTPRTSFYVEPTIPENSANQGAGDPEPFRGLPF